MMDGRANFEPFVEISERGRDLVALGLHVKTCPQTLRDITRVNLIGDNLVYLVIGCRCAGPNGVTCNNLPAVKTGLFCGGLHCGAYGRSLAFWHAECGAHPLPVVQIR